jgi:hypothetical protein
VGFFAADCPIFPSASTFTVGSAALLDFTVPSDGIFIIGVTACCDTNFSGSGTIEGAYVLSVDPLPQFLPWEIVPIDSGPQNVVLYSSIAIDSNDKAHIAYESRPFGGIGSDLKYATNATGQWVTAIVDNSGTVGISASIAIDSNGNAHVSYHDWMSLDLKYATNATGQWVTATLDSLGDLGATTSIAVDSQRSVHIIYLDKSGGVNLKYATNATGQWATSTIDNSGGLCGDGLTIDIAIDSRDILHIAYCDTINGSLKYATNASGQWVPTIVDTLGVSDVSIAIDSNDRVHISYAFTVVMTNWDLKYATNP